MAEITSLYYQIVAILFCYVELLLGSSFIASDYISQLPHSSKKSHVTNYLHWNMSGHEVHHFLPVWLRTRL